MLYFKPEEYLTEEKKCISIIILFTKLKTYSDVNYITFLSHIPVINILACVGSQVGYRAEKKKKKKIRQAR